MTLRLAIFDFLAVPGHAWIWLVARLCGYEFVWGPVHGPDGELDEPSKD